MILFVAPVAKLMRVATGRLEVVAAGGGAEVEVGMEGVALGRMVAVGVAAGCVGLAKGVTACRVPAIAVEVASAEGIEVIEPPQAAVAKRSIAMAIFTKTCGLICFIFFSLSLPLLYVGRIQPLKFCLLSCDTIRFMSKTWMARWGPAGLAMVTIFLFSARPSTELPDLGHWDYFVKKGGHLLGYALLALAYWRGLNLEPGKRWFAWGLAICYAITDELHQGFVPGRHPSLFDILFFDNLGAVLGLVLWESIHAARMRQQA